MIDNYLEREGLLVKSDEERLAHGICDVLQMLENAAEFDEAHGVKTQVERAILRGLLIGTAHEGHRD